MPRDSWVVWAEVFVLTLTVISGVPGARSGDGLPVAEARGYVLIGVMVMNPIEVEFKYPLANDQEVRATLTQLGAVWKPEVEHRDEYFNDPLRNYAELDIALRIRQVGDRFWATYKGPNLDPTAKIREEVELPMADAAAASDLRRIWTGMGLSPVARVIKRRQVGHVSWQGSQVEVCLDQVHEVGGFIELERVVEQPDDVAAARDQLAQLATRLGLSDSTRTSYLEMLLHARKLGSGRLAPEGRNEA